LRQFLLPKRIGRSPPTIWPWRSDPLVLSIGSEFFDGRFVIGRTLNARHLLSHFWAPRRPLLLILILPLAAELPRARRQRQHRGVEASSGRDDMTRPRSRPTKAPLGAGSPPSSRIPGSRRPLQIRHSSCGKRRAHGAIRHDAGAGPQALGAGLTVGRWLDNARRRRVECPTPYANPDGRSG
jgi:hypothetical protein